MNKEPLEKAVNYFKDQIKLLRVGGNNNVILEEVRCSVYNSKMKIRDLGTVNSLGAGTYVINVWDSTVINDVKNAILDSLNLNATIDGSSLKVVFPPVTQEKRVELVKITSRYAEDCLIAIRNIRRDEIGDIEKQFKDKLLSEDQKKSLIGKIDSTIKDYSKMVDDLKEDKIKEINTI